ncbi:inducible metalloproteinase inhibitor protein-like [Cylas formicarius]|uniref:inducible metalloproteinase inhibitor protein-like n=1 Tax=Cylas formicarius TaxID=197179 RepID=UPI002958CE16|nr:inducible metalloproteinase inhibitor protein-like [Cylas formicarius]
MKWYVLFSLVALGLPGAVYLTDCDLPSDAYCEGTYPPGGLDCLNCTAGPNECYSCGIACQTTCATLGCPCNIINIRCNDLCYCRNGFARDDLGTCIPVKDCPPRGPCPE